MDIRKALLKEHSRNQTMRIVNYIGSDKKRFRELMDIFLTVEYRLTQRAAWSLGYCGRYHPELILPYTAGLIKKLREKGIHDAVKRNIMRVWQDIHIPEKYEGEIFDICQTFMVSVEVPAAIKVCSMTVMMNICKAHPALKNELRFLVEDIIPYSKPAIVSRGRKVLKRLDRI